MSKNRSYYSLFDRHLFWPDYWKTGRAKQRMNGM